MSTYNRNNPEVHKCSGKVVRICKGVGKECVVFIALSIKSDGPFKGHVIRAHGNPYSLIDLALLQENDTVTFSFVGDPSTSSSVGLHTITGYWLNGPADSAPAE